VVVEMSFLPVGTPTTRTHELIAPVVEAIRESGLPHEFHAMGTNVEGSWDEVMGLVRRCMDILHDRGVERVAVSLHVSERRDGAANTLRHRREANPERTQGVVKGL
jgi:uncharacterized protein (TIGR00106 family)